MDLEELPHGFLPALADLCHDLNPDGTRRSREILEDLCVEVLPGPRSNYLPPHPLIPGDWSAVMLAYHQFGWTETSALRHETCHAIVDRTGYRDMVLQAHGGSKAHAQPLLEQMALLAGAWLLIPQVTVDATLKLFPLDGDTAMLLSRLSRATPEQAMLRLVFNDTRASVAGFVTSGGVVTRTATCNAWLPFSRYERLPALPDGVRVSRAATWQVGIVA